MDGIIISLYVTIKQSNTLEIAVLQCLVSVTITELLLFLLHAQ